MPQIISARSEVWPNISCQCEHDEDTDSQQAYTSRNAQVVASLGMGTEKNTKEKTTPFGVNLMKVHTLVHAVDIIQTIVTCCNAVQQLMSNLLLYMLIGTWTM
jgi:hypothetical protein